MRATHRLSSATVMAACLAVGPSCSDPTSSGVEVQRALSSGATTGFNLDRDFYDLAGVLAGGFGGYFIADGKSVIYLQSIEDSAVVRLAMLSVLLERRMPSQIEFRRGDYNFRQLLEWRMAFDQSLRGPDFHYSDVDERLNRVVIGVGNSAAANLVSAMAAQLGIPHGAVLSRIGERARPIADIRYYNRPAVGGLQIAILPGGTCTLGLNAERPWFHQEAGRRFMITASHCGSEFQADTRSYYQPWYDPDYHYIGTEHFDPPTFTTNCSNGLSLPCRYSDAAIIEYEDSVSWAIGHIARPINNSGSFTIDSMSPTFQITHSYGYPMSTGWVLHKVGGTTGWSTGEVTATCVNEYFVPPQSSSPTAYLLCQDWFDADADEGDSGSPVFLIESSGEASALGIVWAKYPNGGPIVFSAHSNITTDLGALLVY